MQVRDPLNHFSANTRPYFCKKCGAKLSGSAAICDECGRVPLRNVFGKFFLTMVLLVVAIASYVFIENPVWRNPVVWGAGTAYFLVTMQLIVSQVIKDGELRSAASILLSSLAMYPCAIAGDALFRDTKFRIVLGWIAAGYFTLLTVGFLASIEYRGELRCKAIGTECCLLIALLALGATSHVLNHNEIWRDIVPWTCKIAALFYAISLVFRFSRRYRVVANAGRRT
jgi:hypothetical protein